MYIADEIAKGQIVPLHFAKLNIAASQSAVALEACGLSGGATAYTMPWNYEILGVSFKLSAAGTTGVFTIDPTVGGTANTAGRVTVGTSAGTYTRVNREKIRGNAGDAVGAKITTDGSWDGTTSDLVVTVWVLVHLAGV